MGCDLMKKKKRKLSHKILTQGCQQKYTEQNEIWKKKCLIVYKKTDLYFWDKTASCNRGTKAKTFR